MEPRSINKYLLVLHAIFRRAQRQWGLTVNPAVGVERQPVRRSGDFRVLSPEQVSALVHTPVAGAHHPPAKRQLTAGELDPDGSKTSRTYALTSESANSLEGQGAEGVAQVVEAQVLDVGGPKRGGRPSCTTDRSADAARTLSSSAMRRGRRPTRSSPRLACAGRGMRCTTLQLVGKPIDQAHGRLRLGHTMPPGFVVAPGD